MNGLGNSFMRLFERTGVVTDIDKAISCHSDAVRLTPEGDADKARNLTNLGTSFLCRFERTGELTDIDKAIACHNDALLLTPEGHADKPQILNNTGDSFFRRFENTGRQTDIDRAMSYRNEAVGLTPEGHAAKPGRLNNLGSSLLGRFLHTGEIVDLENAISCHKDAVCFIPDGHANKPAFLKNLASAFSVRYQRTGSRVDLDAAITQYRLSASSSSGPPSVRFHAAFRWARLAFIGSATASLDGYGAALNLLPRIAWLGQTISARHKDLGAIGEIVNEAAAAAIGAGKYETAVEWLEQGRSVVWGQLLNLRSPVDELRDADRELADDLMRISKKLESVSTRYDSQGSSDQQTSMEQAAQSHRQLATDWDMLVEKARLMPGFEDFLQPKTFSKLSQASRFGPVVVINVSQSRCDALIVMADLVHVPLSDFSYEQAHNLQHSLNKLLTAAGVRMRDTRGFRRVSTNPNNYGFEEILSCLWTYVVKPILDAVAFPVGDFLQQTSSSNT